MKNPLTKWFTGALTSLGNAVSPISTISKQGNHQAEELINQVIKTSFPEGFPIEISDEALKEAISQAIEENSDLKEKPEDAGVTEKEIIDVCKAKRARNMDDYIPHMR